MPPIFIIRSLASHCDGTVSVSLPPRRIPVSVLEGLLEQNLCHPYNVGARQDHRRTTSISDVPDDVKELHFCNETTESAIIETLESFPCLVDLPQLLRALKVATADGTYVDTHNKLRLAIDRVSGTDWKVCYLFQFSHAKIVNGPLRVPYIAYQIPS